MDELDRQTYDSMARSGTWCPQAIEKIVKENDIIYFTKPKEYERKKKVMGARHLSDEDYLLFIGEAMAGQVQYGGRTALCEFIQDNVVDKPVEEGEQALIDWLQLEKDEDITKDWM